MTLSSTERSLKPYAGKLLCYLFIVTSVSTWNCLKMQFLVFMPAVPQNAVIWYYGEDFLGSPQTDAIKSLWGQSVLDNGDTDHVFTTCLAGKLIAALVTGFPVAVLNWCVAVVSA